MIQTPTQQENASQQPIFEGLKGLIIGKDEQNAHPAQIKLYNEMKRLVMQIAEQTAAQAFNLGIETRNKQIAKILTDHLCAAHECPVKEVIYFRGTPELLAIMNNDYANEEKKEIQTEPK